MTETKWTPGPWRKNKEFPYDTVASSKHFICQVFPTYDDKSKYNADLISAAPELYDALKETLEIAARYESGDYIERANAAMRKARGE